jgi:phosphonate transport system substrate-binding protein
MEPEKIEKIKTILIETNQTAEGKEVLETFEKTGKFDNFPTEEDIAKMRKFSEQVSNR